MYYIGKILCAVLLCSALTACDEEQLPPGVVGEVNGRYIYLRSLDAMRDAREMNTSEEMPSVETLQEDYSRLLATYILYLLVDDELTRTGNTVPESEITELEASIRASYPADEYETLIKENALDMDEWRRLVRYQLGVELFCDSELRPRVQVKEDEIKAWIAQNREAGSMPEQARVRTLYGTSRESLKNVCRSGKALAPEFSLPEGVSEIQSSVFDMESVMTNKYNYFRAKKKGACGDVFPLDNGFAVMVLEEVILPRTLSLNDMYSYGLDILISEKVNAALLDWVQGQLKTSKVRVSKHLQPGFVEILRQAVEGPRVPELVGPVYLVNEDAQQRDDKRAADGAEVPVQFVPADADPMPGEAGPTQAKPAPTTATPAAPAEAKPAPAKPAPVVPTQPIPAPAASVETKSAPAKAVGTSASNGLTPENGVRPVTESVTGATP